MQIYKKKKRKKNYMTDNEGFYTNLRYIGYVHFLKEYRSKINVGKEELTLNEHEQFLLSLYVC